MSRLEIRLLGGFEVWHGDQMVRGFESQKVRALLAYLLLHQVSHQSRDRLAGLLWPDRDDDTARRNLRQAVYNLRTTLPHSNTGSPAILTTHQNVQFNPETDYWLDVKAFEDAIRRSTLAEGGIAPQHLAEASDLYRGDFMAGFFITGSPDFEHWLLYEQERLREMAIQALRRLVDYYLASGAYRQGIRYGRRLLEIDPLFEEAHRNLIRLYALSGRRSRALAQYEDCRALLYTELGVEPLEETTALYHAIVADKWPSRFVEGESTLPGPRFPFIGREAASARLRRSWEATRHGGGRLTLVEGEAGVGKTSLIELFIRQIAAESPTLVLSGRCYERVPRVGFQPISDALRAAITERACPVQEALAGMSSQELAELARLVPELRASCPDLPKLAPFSDNRAHHLLFEAVAQFLRKLAQAYCADESVNSVILFLDDLHWASRFSLDLLQYLVRRLNSIPIWIVAAFQPGELAPEHPLLPLRCQLSRHQWVDCVALDRLSSLDIQQVAAAVVSDEQAGNLARFLDLESAGLPLTIVELVNFLYDRGILVASDADRWTLAGPLPTLATPTSENLHDLIMRRVSQLPTSARRLLTLAAVIGPQFDAELLQDAAAEHRAVVDASSDIWVERRLVRLVPWQGIRGVRRSVTEHQADSSGSRTFEFAHDKIRQAIYQDLSPQRRQVIHRQVAEAIENRYRQGTGQVVEALAYHYVAARVWDKALTYLQQAGHRARESLAGETALHYYDQALEVLDRLDRGADSEADRQALLEERFRVLAWREGIYRTQELQDTQQADLNLQRMKDIAAQLDHSDYFPLAFDQLGQPDFSNGREI